METMKADEIAEAILRETGKHGQGRKPLLVAIDGRCAAGKTTVAERLREKTGCCVIHMDHFFLRPEQRTAERLREPGGNVDRERFIEEVAIPLRRGDSFSYRPYDCRSDALAEPIEIAPDGLVVIEGSYCCHPALRDLYDARFFITVDAIEQLERIERRNGASCAVRFREKWIPLEERYFSACRVEETSDRVFLTPGSDS